MMTHRPFLTLGAGFSLGSVVVFYTVLCLRRVTGSRPPAGKKLKRIIRRGKTDVKRRRQQSPTTAVAGHTGNGAIVRRRTREEEKEEEREEGKEEERGEGEESLTDCSSGSESQDCSEPDIETDKQK